jgi:cell wall assembly regulator SMI1
MTGELPRDLLARIRARLADDWRRTGVGDFERTPRERRRLPGFLGDQQPGVAALGSLLGSLGGGMARRQAPPPLPPLAPVGAAALAKAETKLGFVLPIEVRQLYGEVADGGFGPWGGLLKLASLVANYGKLRAEPVEGHDWPAELLPLQSDSEGRLCIDRNTGAIVTWDRRAAKKRKPGAWEASFSVQARSLQDWLERWVDTPTVYEGGPPGGIRLDPPATPELGDERAMPPPPPPEAREGAPLPDDLVHRIAARARDPLRRTHLAGIAAAARPLDMGSLLAGLQQAGKPAGDKLAGMAGALGALLGQMKVTAAGPGHVIGPATETPLGTPASATDLAAAEAKLGFKLPLSVRQLYGIANGGFGPGEGLPSLDELTRRYRARVATPQGPLDQPWPPELLPLFYENPGDICLDLVTGAVVRWDPEEIEDELDDAHWQSSFVPAHPSLEALMVDWLAT